MLDALSIQQRQSLPARSPELYAQICEGCAQGVWYANGLAGAIGWNDYPIPAGAQVVLKGRNFADKPVLLFLRYSRLADFGEQVIIIPRLSYDFFPVGLESCGFDLPWFVTGKVRVQLLVDGRWSNEVIFEVR